jgi:hypothetical protein
LVAAFVVVFSLRLRADLAIVNYCSVVSQHDREDFGGASGKPLRLSETGVSATAEKQWPVRAPNPC